MSIVGHGYAINTQLTGGSRLIDLAATVFLVEEVEVEIESQNVVEVELSGSVEIELDGEVEIE